MCVQRLAPLIDATEHVLKEAGSDVLDLYLHFGLGFGVHGD